MQHDPHPTQLPSLREIGLRVNWPYFKGEMRKDESPGLRQVRGRKIRLAAPHQESELPPRLNSEMAWAR
jgi:hypothetical protein